MANINEQICEAASIIAKGVVQDMHFDQTIKAVILQDNDYDLNGQLKVKLNGEYLCKLENTTFLAYGSPCAYKPNDIVYVKIPMGDWGNKKFIIGNNDGINLVYVNGQIKVFDNSGDYLCDIGNEKTYQDSEILQW